MSTLLGIDSTTALLFLTVAWLVATDETPRRRGFVRYLVSFAFILHAIVLVLRALA